LPVVPIERYREIFAATEASTMLAEDAGRVLAYSTFGVNRDDDTGPAVGEIRSFFADPDAWGRGAAPRLIADVLARLAELGYAEVTLWSFAANARANAFYERHGMERDGGRRTQEAWADIAQVRYRRTLAV